MTEASVVGKVEELMESIDNTKRYTVFAKSLKKFALILSSSIIAYIIARTIFSF
jgi:hypothetical protein